MSANNTVKFKLDPKSSLKPAQRKRMAVVATLPDAEINYDDLPRKPKSIQWTRPGALVPTENKRQVTLRLDAEVLNFFKSTGQRYQSRINAALREYMKAHQKTVG